MSLPSLRQNDILLSGLLSLMIKLGTDETIDLCGKNFHKEMGGGGVAEMAGALGLVSDTRDRPVPGL